MTKEDLLTTLRELKESRLVASEVDALLDPFREDTFKLNFSFVSSSPSLGSQADPAYNDGYTIVCQVGAAESECSVHMFASENSRLENLRPGDELELNLKVLGFDSLYQRVTFGQVAKDSGFVKPEESAEQNVEKLKALVGLLEKRVDQLQEADDVVTETERIQTELPLEGVPEFVVKQDKPREQNLASKREKMIQEQKSLDRFDFYMRAMAYMMAVFFYGLGGLACLIGVLSIFDPSEPVLMFLFAGPLFLGVGHFIWKALRS